MDRPTFADRCESATRRARSRASWPAPLPIDLNAHRPRTADRVRHQRESDGQAVLDRMQGRAEEIARVEEDGLPVCRANEPAGATANDLRDAAGQRRPPAHERSTRQLARVGRVTREMVRGRKSIMLLGREKVGPIGAPADERATRQSGAQLQCRRLALSMALIIRLRADALAQAELASRSCERSERLAQAEPASRCCERSERLAQAGAGGGNRTHTGGKPHKILSLARLPVSPLRREGGRIDCTTDPCKRGATVEGILPRGGQDARL